MKIIWKFTLIHTSTKLELPTGAEILTTKEQHGEICIWFKIDSLMIDKKEKRFFEMYNTGQPMCANYKKEYIGSVSLYGGDIIKHVFESINK